MNTVAVAQRPHAVVYDYAAEREYLALNNGLPFAEKLAGLRAINDVPAIAKTVTDNTGYVQVPYLGNMHMVLISKAAALYHVAVNSTILAHAKQLECDAIVDIGCGTGHAIAEVAEQLDLPCFGCEINDYALDCLEMMTDKVSPVVFNIARPNFSFLEGKYKHPLIVSNFSLVYADKFPAYFWQELKQRVATFDALMFEPVSFELANRTATPLFTREQFEQYGLSYSFFDELRKSNAAGEIVIQQLTPDYCGLSRFSSVTLIHAKDAAQLQQEGK